MSVASVPQLLQEVETSKVFHWPTSAHSLVERLAAALEHTTVERDHACTLQTLAEEDRDALRAQREALVEALRPFAERSADLEPRDKNTLVPTSLIYAARDMIARGEK